MRTSAASPSAVSDRWRRACSSGSSASARSWPSPSGSRPRRTSGNGSMANDESTEVVPAGRAAAVSGTAVERADAFQNPGLPPHRARVTDQDPKKAKRAERTIVGLFYLSIVGAVIAMASYFAFPIKPDDLGSVRLDNLLLGLGLSLALLAIGVGAVHWGKVLMVDHEGVDIRHPQRGDVKTCARAVEIMQLANGESAFGRRPLTRTSLIAAVAFLPFPALFLFRDLAPAYGTPAEAYSHTMWKTGSRLTKDPSGVPIKASDVTIGSVFHVIPE